MSPGNAPAMLNATSVVILAEDDLPAFKVIGILGEQHHENKNIVNIRRNERYHRGQQSF